MVLHVSLVQEVMLVVTKGSGVLGDGDNIFDVMVSGRW